jgi:DNA-binding beta-propeller fold protein YncE
MRLSLRAKFQVFFAISLLSLAAQARAEVIVVTSSSTNSIYEISNLSGSPLVTLIGSTFGKPDGIGVQSFNTLLYLSSTASGGFLESMNVLTGVSSTLASGFSSPRDFVIEPGGATALVADAGNSSIVRVDLTTGIKTILTSGWIPDGITYNSGLLFAVKNGNQLVNLNPLTGAILFSNQASALDGLSSGPNPGDPIWATNPTDGGIFKIINVASSSATFTETSLGLSSPDGILVDPFSNRLYVAGNGNGQLNVVSSFPTPTLLGQISVPGVDEVAVAANLATPAPEPACIIPVGVGLLIIAKKRLGPHASRTTVSR